MLLAPPFLFAKPLQTIAESNKRIGKETRLHVLGGTGGGTHRLHYTATRFVTYNRISHSAKLIRPRWLVSLLEKDYLFRLIKSLGVIPCNCLKTRLKLRMVENPLLVATSVMVISVVRSKDAAKSTRY